MVRFIDPGIRVQSRVDHDAVNEVIDDAGDWVDAAEAFVKCGGLWHRIRSYKIGSNFPWYLASSVGEQQRAMLLSSTIPRP